MFLTLPEFDGVLVDERVADLATRLARSNWEELGVTIPGAGPTAIKCGADGLQIYRSLLSLVEELRNPKPEFFEMLISELKKASELAGREDLSVYQLKKALRDMPALLVLLTELSQDLYKREQEAFADGLVNKGLFWRALGTKVNTARFQVAEVSELDDGAEPVTSYLVLKVTGTKQSVERAVLNIHGGLLDLMPKEWAESPPPESGELDSPAPQTSGPVTVEGV